MFKRSLLIICAALYLVSFTVLAHAQLPQISSGLDYLTSSQNQDGTWNAGNSQTEITAATVSVLETMKLMNQTAGTSYTSGVSWLQAQTPLSVDYIAQRIRTLSLTDVSLLTPSADLTKGGWGGDAGYETNPLDTASALQTLKAANYSDLTTINPALAYLTGGQNPDGGWGFSFGDDSNLYMTAIVSATLQQFPQMASIATAVNKATSYLFAHQNPDGGFGSSPSTAYESALAYTALAAFATNEAALGNAVNYLTATQFANGSWNDDPYSTALAIKALYLSENRPSPPPLPPAGGKITGTVVDKTTNQHIGNVAVVLESNQLINTTTDSFGNFTLSDIPAGAQKVNFSLTGYASTAVTATVVVDTTASLGNVQMLSSYSTGTIAGTITDSSGKPLADVAMTVSGAWSGNAITGADGTYAFTYVTPGPVTITAAKTGFLNVSAPGTVYARTTISFSPRLSTTASQVTTGTLVGRVVDSYWGLPVDHLPGERGMYVMLSGGFSAEPDPNNRGIFSIEGLPPNTYQVIVGMNGFAGKVFQVVISPGVTTDLGTIRLEMSFLMTLAGKITDASTGAPIPGAEVTLSDGKFTGRADFAGTYAIADIPNPGEYTVKFSAAGYVGKSFTMGSSPWLQTMDIALSPRITTGSLTGTVVDFATNLPLAGVTLTLKNDPAVSTTTDSSGVFTFNTVLPGPQQVSLALSGYSTRTLTTTVTVGAVSNAGKLHLAATELPASIQGTVWDAIAKAPFSAVTIQATGTGLLQTVTAVDGTYQIDNVTPGAVTIAATALSKPNYSNSRFTGTLEPGGILVFNPTLSTTLPGTIGLSVQTDKLEYGTGDTVGIAISLKNSESEAIATALHVRVTEPSGANAYETSVNVSLEADGSADQSLSFSLPATAWSGRYIVLTEAYNSNGAMLGNSYKTFDVTVSQIATTTLLPATFSTGANTISFSLVNTGTLPVSAGTLGVTLKDPDGTIVSTVVQNFSLALGENKTITAALAIPALKFGTYTLSYVQSDETKAGQVTDILLPNTLAVSALYDDASHRIREKANLTVTLRNTGRFNLDTGSTSQAIVLMAEVPDAAYAETKTLSPAPVAGSAAGSVMLYQFTIPETMNPGQHGTRITVTLPSGSTTVQTAQLAITESSLLLSPVQSAHTAGDTIYPAFTNSGGVDTQVQYHLSLYDAKAALIAESTNTGTVFAGSSLLLSLPIPTGAVDGSYNLVINYKDTKTGKEGMSPNAITISGVKGALQIQTDKQNYLLTENISGTSSTTSSGTPLTNGNLHLQVTTGAGVEKTKTWATQADFQTGVRSGVDTYGVNDWIIPDDDFSGASIDANKWAVGGNVSIQDGKLFVDTTQAVASSGISGKWLLEGDFDIQVDFMSNNSTSWTGAQFYASCSNSWISIGNYTAAGYASQVSFNGVQQSYVSAGNSASSGQVRITRTNNKIVAYYWAGTSWIALNNSTSSALADPCSVGMTIYRSANFPGATATFDNFKVNSGRIKNVNQTADSVRLLPLNDNFDDGVLNEDRWNTIGAAGHLPTENNGVLRMFVPQNNTTDKLASYVKLKNVFTTDFGASVDFNMPTPWTSPDNHTLDLSMSTPNYSMRVFLQRAPWHIGPTVGSQGTNSGGNWVFVENVSNQGKLKISRSGDKYSSLYWNGGGWTNLLNEVGSSDGATSTTIGTWTHAGAQQLEVLLDKFTVLNQSYSGVGTLSLKYDSGTSNNKWGKLLHSSTQPVGTSIKFRTRTAETEAGLVTATWSDYLTASGSPVTSPAARCIEIESTFATTDTNVTPLLNDLSVTYEANSGEILWQADVPVTLAQDTINQLNHTIGTLGMTGKFYLEGTLTSSTGQTVATAEYPFYVEQGNIQVSLATDKKIYRRGETVTISGEVKNLSSIAAAGLTAQIQGAGISTPYLETFDLPDNSSHPFSFTTTAGSDGTYLLTGSVTQNSAPLVDISDQYEVASPVLAATLAAPETAGNMPFVISVSLANSGKVSATTTIHVVDESGSVIDDQIVTLPAGETRILQYTRQITGAISYTAVMSGDLIQTLTKKVVYSVLATDSSISGKIVTDKVSYNPNEQVTLTTTITAASSRENLSALVTVSNGQGQAMYSVTIAIPVLIQSQIVTNSNLWNTGAYPAGVYLVTLQILDPAGSVIAKTTCNLVINSTTNPVVLLKGKVSLDKQSILTGEVVTVSYSVTNTGNVDLANIPLTIQAVNMTEQTIYNTIISQTALTMGATSTNSGLIDTHNYSAKDYLVVLRATIGGVEETLAGTYFRVEGAPSAPALSGPANGSDLDIFTPQLSVSNAADPNDDKLTYEFEIYSDIGLTNLATSGTVTETTGTTSWEVPAPLAENQVYYWRARAYDGRLYSSWMTLATFRVNTVNDLPSVPTVSSPAEGTAVAVLAPALTVNNASDPDSMNLIYNFDLALDQDFSQIVATVKGVASGQDTTSWLVPVNLLENGWYYWRAQADDWLAEGPWSTTARFLVNTANDAPSAPVVVAPANGATITVLATDVVVTNSIDPDSSSLLYYFEVDTVPTFDSTGIIRSGMVAEGYGTTLWHLGGLQDNSRYYLRVKSSDGSADSPWSTVTGFFVNTANDPPSTPVLANPSNGAGVNLFTPTLSVHNATDLDNDILTYEFEIYADASMTTLVAQSGSIAEAALVTGWTVPVSLVENQIYYWRARAGDGSLYSNWMPTVSFMVNTANDAPGAPQLLSPGEGSSLTTLAPTLEVVNATDPDSTELTYDFEVYSNNLLVTSVSGVPAGTSGKTSTALNSALVDNMSYTWRARAFDGDSYGQWMNMATFSTHIAQSIIRVDIEFEPKTLNRKSEGKWVNVEIELPHGYRASDVDVSSIRLEGSVSAELWPYQVRGHRHEHGCNRDHKNHEHSGLSVKFRRNNVIAVLPEGKHVPVHVTGKIGTLMFEGMDIIRVIK